MKKLSKWNNQMKKNMSILKNLPQEKSIKDLIHNIDAIRNNLAHANSSKRLEDVRNDIQKALGAFEEVCINKNILKVPA
jgi:hypothetical protein